MKTTEQWRREGTTKSPSNGRANKNMIGKRLGNDGNGRHFITKFTQLFQVRIDLFLTIEFIVEVGAKVFEGFMVFQHVVNSGEDRMRHRHSGDFGSSAHFDPLKLSIEEGIFVF